MSDARQSRQHIAAAVAKMQSGDHHGAAAEWVRAIELQPDHPQLHTGFEALGTCYANVGDLENAESAYREAIRRSPGFSQAHAGLGNVLVARGLYTQAMDEYRVAIERPSDPDLRPMVRTGLQAITIKAHEQAARLRAKLMLASLEG